MCNNLDLQFSKIKRLLFDFLWSYRHLSSFRVKMVQTYTVLNNTNLPCSDKSRGLYERHEQRRLRVMQQSALHVQYLSQWTLKFVSLNMSLIQRLDSQAEHIFPTPPFVCCNPCIYFSVTVVLYTVCCEALLRIHTSLTPSLYYIL